MLRIYRIWTWELDVPLSEVRMGGSNPMKLVPHDTLQYCVAGEWLTVEVVEAEKPLHPEEIRKSELSTKLAESFRVGELGITTDPNDPRLGRGIDEKSTPQHEVYLVLSDEERAKGFVRPVRRAYKHVGPLGPLHPLRDLTLEEKERYAKFNYVKFEAYPEKDSVTGRFWTQAQLDAVGTGCGTVTTMGLALAETYARNPEFYGATYCVQCRKHLPVEEFIWDKDGSVVGS